MFRTSSGIQDVFLQNIHLYIAGSTPGLLFCNFKIIYFKSRAICWLLFLFKLSQGIIRSKCENFWFIANDVYHYPNKFLKLKHVGQRLIGEYIHYVNINYAFAIN